MMVRFAMTQSINSREYCVYYTVYRQCQFNKVDIIPTSITYFRQILVFILETEWVFAKSYVKIQFFHNSVSCNITR